MRDGISSKDFPLKARLVFGQRANPGSGQSGPVWGFKGSKIKKAMLFKIKKNIKTSNIKGTTPNVDVAECAQTGFYFKDRRVLSFPPRSPWFFKKKPL